MKSTNPHYTILKSLYDLYKENKDNKAVLDKISAISWALEFELKFEIFGYFELSELIGYGNQNSAPEHYLQVIENSLHKLQNAN